MRLPPRVELRAYPGTLPTASIQRRVRAAGQLRSHEAVPHVVGTHAVEQLGGERLVSLCPLKLPRGARALRTMSS